MTFLRSASIAAATLAFLAGPALAPAFAQNKTDPKAAGGDKSELYRQLNLFGDVFERIRADYVESPDDAKLIESAINGMLTVARPALELPERRRTTATCRCRPAVSSAGSASRSRWRTASSRWSPRSTTRRQKAGMMTNDFITHIDGEQVQGLTLNEAVEKMRGPVNTEIKLTIRRGAEGSGRR
jgi:carboxyl-terminal processing protease